MTALVILLLVIVLAIFLVKTKKSGALGGEDSAWPFQAKKPLTEPEQVLYFRLRQALPDQVVLAQVQLSQFLAVKKGHNQQSWRNRINRMSADFVICAKDASVLAVIELDDATHTRADIQCQQIGNAPTSILPRKRGRRSCLQLYSPAMQVYFTTR